MHNVEQFLDKYGSRLRDPARVAIVDAPLTESTQYTLLENIVPEGYSGSFGGHANVVGVHATKGLKDVVGLIGVGKSDAGWGESMEPIFTRLPDAVCFPRDTTSVWSFRYFDDTESDNDIDNIIEDLNHKGVVFGAHYYRTGSYPAEGATAYENVIVATHYRQFSDGRENVGPYRQDLPNVVVDSGAASYASGLIAGVAGVLNKAFPEATPNDVVSAIVQGASVRTIKGNDYRWLDMLGAADILAGLGPDLSPELDPEPDQEPELPSDAELDPVVSIVTTFTRRSGKTEEVLVL